MGRGDGVSFDLKLGSGGQLIHHLRKRKRRPVRQSRETAWLVEIAGDEQAFRTWFDNARELLLMAVELFTDVEAGEGERRELAAVLLQLGQIGRQLDALDRALSASRG